MPAKITAETDQDWKEVFDLFDKDKNGRICVQELRKVVCGLGFDPTESQLKEMIASVDKDQDGTIEYEDFRRLMYSEKKKLKRGDEHSAMENAFKVFDKDGNGYITAEELRKTMSTLGETLRMDEINEMIKVADRNQDGKLDYAEFAKFICQK